MSVEIFSNVYNGPFRRYLLLSKSIGKDVQNQSETADLAFQAEMRYLEYSQNFKKPVLENIILSPIVDQINGAVKYTCTDPAMADHVKVVGQSIKALLWIQQIDPVGYLEEVIADAKAYTDVLLVFFKDKDFHVEWVDAWIETLNDLSNFVRRRYPMGLTWKGENDALDATLLENQLQTKNNLDLSDLLKEINKGETIQPVLSGVNQQPDLQPSVPSEKLLSNNNVIFIQEGKKWRIEHKKGSHKHITIDKADNDNVIYIYDCSNITIVVEKKLNVIKLDSCDKICLIFRSLISGIEMISCKNMKLHSFGTLPSVNIDNCSEINIHMTIKGMDAQVVTTQSNKISLSYPLEDGYYKTFNVPSRMMTTITPGHKLKTVTLIDE